MKAKRRVIGVNMLSLFYLTGVSEFVPGRESISRHCRPPGIADPDGDQDPH